MKLVVKLKKCFEILISYFLKKICSIKMYLTPQGQSGKIIFILSITGIIKINFTL